VLFQHRSGPKETSALTLQSLKHGRVSASYPTDEHAANATVDMIHM
jgi:hypothetical protein